MPWESRKLTPVKSTTTCPVQAVRASIMAAHTWSAVSMSISPWSATTTFPSSSGVSETENGWTCSSATPLRFLQSARKRSADGRGPP